MNPLKQIPIVLYGGPLDGWKGRASGAATELRRPGEDGMNHLYVWTLRRVRRRRVFKFHASCKSVRTA